MAVKHSLNIACLNLREADRMPLTSAFNTAAATMNTELIWTDAHAADIRIVDVTQMDPDSVDPVVIRYSTRQNGKPVDIVRPIHVRALIEVLGNAINTALLLREQQKAREATTVHYRGGIIEKKPQSHSSDNHNPDQPTAKKQVIYRGARVD